VEEGERRKEEGRRENGRRGAGEEGKRRRGGSGEEEKEKEIQFEDNVELLGRIKDFLNTDNLQTDNQR